MSDRIGNVLDHREQEYKKTPLHKCVVTGIMLTDNYCMGTEAIPSCKFWAKWLGDSRYSCHYERIRDYNGGR